MTIESLPVIVTAPGTYVTRGGDLVRVDTVSRPGQCFGCIGSYRSGGAEAWHASGRLYFGMESHNDIVSGLKETAR